MPTIGTVVVNVQLNNAQFLTQINRTNQATQRAMSQMQRSVSGLDRGFLVLRRTFLSFFAISTVTRAVRDVANYADAWKQATNQVAAANSIATLQSRSMESLNALAAETRTSLGDTAELYSRLLRSTEGLAKSEEEVAEVTKTVTMAFKAGGASMQEAANGARQLGQSLASGIFQGDELRSIRENAPLLAQAIATEFNTTIGGLKKLGAEGKLTADRVFRAISQNAKPIRDAFAATNATIADSFQILNDAITEYMGEADKANGVSASFTKTLLDLAKALREANKQPTGTSQAGNFWTDTKIVANAIADGLNKLTGLTNKGTQSDIAEFFTSIADAMRFAKEETEKLTAAVETFDATQRRTGVGGVNLPQGVQTFAASSGRGFTGAGVGGFSPSKETLDDIMKWREEAKGASGDMARLAAAAQLGEEAFEQMGDRIEAETFLLSKGVPLRSLTARQLTEEYIAAKKAERGFDDLVNSVEEYQDLQTELVQQGMLQGALSQSILAYRELKIHLEAVNMATAAGVPIATEYGRAWIAVAEAGLRAKEMTAQMAERLDEVAQTINSTVTSSISAVSSAFADAVVQGESFRDMLDALLKDLAKLALNAAFQLFLKQIIGGIATTSAGGTGLLGMLVGGGTGQGGLPLVPGGTFGDTIVPQAMGSTIQFHKGGVVGMEGLPRFHNGLMPNEFPAVLNKGEGVFTKEQMKALGGGKGEINIHIDNRNGSDVKARGEKDENGDINIEIVVDQIVGRKLLQPGASSNRAMKQGFGAQPVGIRR